jgi:hypothetical protein
MCKINPDNQHHIREHRLIVKKCGKGDKKGYRAMIIDFAVVRIEGPKGKTLQEALERIFDFTADQLKPHLEGYEDMRFSHIKDEELVSKDGGRIAMKKGRGAGAGVAAAGDTPGKAFSVRAGSPKKRQRVEGEEV